MTISSNNETSDQKTATVAGLHPILKSSTLVLRCNTLLHQALRHHLTAMHRASNYTFSSVADLLRHILAKIERGELGLADCPAIDAEYQTVCVRVSDAQKNFWQRLPHRNRRLILEKAITEFVTQIKPSQLFVIKPRQVEASKAGSGYEVYSNSFCDE